MYQVDDKGFFGKFGGAYVPEILYKCVTELQEAYKPIIESEEFKKECKRLRVYTIVAFSFVRTFAP